VSLDNRRDCLLVRPKDNRITPCVMAVSVAVAVCRQGVERIAIGDLDTGVYDVNASNGDVLTGEVTSVASSPDGALWQC
jgi:hypothetical protein